MPPFSRAGGAGDGEEGVREHREGHMSVPAVVAADLVVVQAHFSLACLEGQQVTEVATSTSRSAVSRKFVTQTQPLWLGCSAPT